MEGLLPAGVKHFCNPGDLIASMAGLKAFYKNTGRRINLYQQLNVPANYYQGATHGTTADNDSSTMVCMNSRMWNRTKPLLLSQDYINSAEEFIGQDILIDIDVIRKKVFVNLPHGQIQAWVMYAYPDLAYDLSQPWVTLLPNEEIESKVEKQVEGKILLNFTERYRNAHIQYYFLRKYKHRLIFAGTEREHLLFMNAWKIDMPRLIDDNFLETAYALQKCKFMLGNQSAVWNLAEAIKSPRILELCEFAANCMPFVGEKSYGFYHQQGVEHYCDLLTSD